MHSIKTDLKRLNFHDCKLLTVVKDNGKIIAEFDSAFLSNFVEYNIETPIVLGKCFLVIDGIKNEEFRLYPNDKYHVEKIPSNIGEFWNEIQNSNIDDENRRILLDGMYYENSARDFWTEWTFDYDKAELKWEKHHCWKR